MPFRDITGHGRTLALLTGSIALRTLPPSLIFTGIAGIGKRGTALALAQTLNCANPRAATASGDGPSETMLAIDACGECPSCRRIARLVHPDVIVIGPDEDTGNIRIEEVRALTERLGYRPFEARWRVVVIDNADRLVPAAQNALLKTLEEPPTSSVFVLVTARLDDLLPTVRSRCPQIRFAPLPIPQVAEVLQRDHQMATRDAQALAAVSGGSVGAALDAASASLADARESAEKLLVRLASRPDARTRLQAAGEIVGKTAKGYGAGERDLLATHLHAVHSILRDIGALTSAGPDAPISNADLRPALSRLTQGFDRGRLLGAYEAIDKALAALQSNASPKIVADWVVLQI